jgi:ATP synthase protein I
MKPTGSKPPTRSAHPAEQDNRDNHDNQHNQDQESSRAGAGHTRTNHTDTDRIEAAAQRAVLRERRAREEPEPSLGSRLGQIGILGWSIVLPTLAGLALGHWLDRRFGTGVFFSAPLLMIGAAFGLWSAWKWMHRQNRSKG